MTRIRALLLHLRVLYREWRAWQEVRAIVERHRREREVLEDVTDNMERYRAWSGPRDEVRRWN